MWFALGRRQMWILWVSLATSVLKRGKFKTERQWNSEKHTQVSVDFWTWSVSKWTIFRLPAFVCFIWTHETNMTNLTEEQVFCSRLTYLATIHSSEDKHLTLSSSVTGRYIQTALPVCNSTENSYIHDYKATPDQVNKSAIAQTSSFYSITTMTIQF